MRKVAVAGTGEDGDATAAFTCAIRKAFAGLVAEKAPPQCLSHMVWAAPDPVAIHPSRPEIDRAWRHAFAGFRPPVRIEQSVDGKVHVNAFANVPSASPSAEPVFRNYNVAELASQMSPRNQVPDMGDLFDGWMRDGAAARARHGGLDLSYGPHRHQLLDIYRPEGAVRPPVWAFIHGGYWQASSKDEHAQFCAGMLRAGFAVANIDYGLAPETPLSEIVTHVRAALNFIAREADNLSIDVQNMHVAGHSAGGHLAAFAACDKDAPPLRSALLLSGIFDLQALQPIPMGPILGLKDGATADGLSPVRMSPRAGTRIGVALGVLESDEFKRQSAEIASLWNAPAPLLLEGAHHFSLLDGLNSGPLLDLALATAGA